MTAFHRAGRQAGWRGGSPEASPWLRSHPAGLPMGRGSKLHPSERLLRLEQKWIPAGHRQVPKERGHRRPLGPRPGAPRQWRGHIVTPQAGHSMVCMS